MRVLASGNFPFSVPAKLAHGSMKKKGEKSLPLLLPSLLFSWLSTLLISPPSLLSGQAWKKLQSFEYLHGKRDSSRRRMTRARPSPSRLYLLPAMRLLSHLLPREAQGLLLAKIHAKKKNHNEIGARAEDLYKQTTVCPYERVFHVVFVRCTKDTRNVAERNYRSKS